MAITPLPTPPTRSDPATFAARGDAFMTALPLFVSEANALQITTNAQTAADAAASAASAADAVVAKNAAIAAWAASMSPAETLPALSQSLHIGAVVKAIVYDTSKDSDGGAWRKRCADKSWYTESLGFTGTWGGQCASNAAGWAACGSVVGGAYQSTADGHFYAPTSASAQTQIFRGNAREFPEAVAVVAEAARVVIYDLTQVGTPMFMVFSKGADLQLYSGAISSVAARDGLLAVGENTTGALSLINFIADLGYFRLTNTSRYSAGRISRRNTSNSLIEAGVVAALVNRDINDVAITVLDTAPIDPATGLPVPTIAVATAGGISVIRDSGTVVNSAVANSFSKLSIDAAQRIWATDSTASLMREYAPVGGLAASFADIKTYSGVTIPAVISSMGSPSVSSNGATGSALGTVSGLSLFKDNPTTPALGMVVQRTNTYSSGWLPGDIRGAYLADTTAETVTASGELVLTPDFASDTNWTKGTGWTISGGKLLYSSGSLYSNTNQVITTVAGRTYSISLTIDSISVSTISLIAYNGFVGGTTLASLTALAAAGTHTFNVTATSTSIAFAIQANSASLVCQLDNVSVKLAEPDRSVKNKGLVINGSLTKTAVASGAGLVAYSGFSGSNYLEQPANTDLDFGTGDFCVMGWANITSVAGQYLISRGSGAAPLIAISLTTNWGVICHATGTAADTGAAYVPGLYHVALVRASGVLSLYVNGVSIWSAANTQNVTNTNAVLTIGVLYTHTVPFLGSLALWRISATAPSADQIAHIYRTELPLFQPNAQCTIAGSSTAVIALAYDDTTELLHVGTSWGRTGFKDLLRVDSEATTTGALTSLSASQGVIITGGTSGKVYVPAMLLRDELRRKDEARKALGKTPVFFDYTATASQTAFVAPKGYTIKALYHNGTLKRETTTGVYWTRSSDGFAETATISVGATVSDWISLMCVRQG